MPAIVGLLSMSVWWDCFLQAATADRLSAAQMHQILSINAAKAEATGSCMAGGCCPAEHAMQS